MVLSGYSGLDWAEDWDNQKLTSAYTYCVGDGAVELLFVGRIELERE
jgi:hypothetical protein